MPGTPQLRIAGGGLFPEAALALREPPRSFSAFALTPLAPPEGPGWVQQAHFAIACKTCGGDAFHLGAHPMLTLVDGGPFDATNLRPPHRLRCANCGAAEMLFDPTTDGYDGVLGIRSAYEQGQTEEIFTPTAMKTFVAATYNIQLDELQELAAEVGAKPTDLFDWINIIQAEPPGDVYSLELDYECA